MESPTILINGTPHSLATVPPYLSLLDWLREEGLTGAKEGCAEGECGACSVLVASPGISSATEWTAVNACLIPAWSMAGGEVVTSEGLGAAETLHPVQHEMAVRGGSQCGYCTPGFVCSMAAEYYRPGRSDDVTSSANDGGHGHGAQDAAGHGSGCCGDPEETMCGSNGFDLHALSGNLCRCTGYRPIRDAAYALGEPAADDPLQQRLSGAPPVVPATTATVGDQRFIRPETLTEALHILAEEPQAQVVAGCTDWGVEVNLRSRRAPVTLAIDHLPDLRQFSLGPEEITLGAALTLTEIERRLDGELPLLAEVFPQFASRLIRNRATIGGNIGTGSPIGDVPPALLALEAEVELVGPDGARRVPLANYFTGYRQSVRTDHELIAAIHIPRPLAPAVAFHKLAKRRFDDISSVAVAFALEIDGGVVRRACIGAGGVAATPIRARETEGVLTGATWTEDSVRGAADVLAQEGTPMSDHRASSAYRQAMLTQSLLKFYAQRPQEVGA